MPTPSCFRTIRKIGQAALLGAVCVWGASAGLELQPERLAQLAEQRYGPKGAQAVSAWLQKMQGAAALPERDKLARINEFWNRAARFDDDARVWSQADYWATPLEMLGKGAGDCEDYVIGKYVSLIQLGVDPAKLRFIYVRARLGGDQVAHMVLGYYASATAEPLVLDSLISIISPASQRPDLTPVFSFNAEGVYIDGREAAPVDRLGRWRDLLVRMEQEGIRL